MAIVTKQVASDVGGLCRAEVDYDNATVPPTFTAVRVWNATDRNYLINLTTLNGARIDQLVFSPNGGVPVTFSAIPAGRAQQYATVNAKGNVELNISTSWPSDLPATPGL